MVGEHGEQARAVILPFDCFYYRNLRLPLFSAPFRRRWTLLWIDSIQRRNSVVHDLSEHLVYQVLHARWKFNMKLAAAYV